MGRAVARAAVFACAAVAALVGHAGRVGRCDEGMWLFTQPPRERLAAKHGFAITPEWLLHLQQASVRFNSGGSGSFVSADGLVLTNHHVAADSLQKLGDHRRDYYRDGFAAATRADELRCPDLELNVLISVEDVTARVRAAVGTEADPATAAATRRRTLAAIEQESLAATGLRSDVVTLHQGGLYHLYRSKKYTDVRLVFAPEQQIAFFGGDADNFEFPRYDLDICFFRAYQDGKPARVPHHLRWAGSPVAAGDLVFVSGHPGHTDRGRTVAELVALRDRRFPADLDVQRRLESLLTAYAAEGTEERRQAMGELFGAQNGRKARQGVLAGLLDPAVFAARRRAEEQIRPGVDGALDGRPSPYARIEEAQRDLDRIAVRHRLLEAGTAFNSRFFATARMLLRSAEERGKPSGERLREYRDSNRESLEQQLFSPEPLYDEFEIVKLADSLTHLAGMLGAEDPLVKAVLDGASPRDRAARLVRGTRLGRRPDRPGSPAVPDDRRAIHVGGAAAVAASDDTMLALARLVDGEARAVRKVAEAAQEVKQQAHAEIARSRFAREGDALYPDATFTLRLAYGTVTGYEEEGRRVEPITTYAGLFARAAAKGEAPPFDLPSRWRELRPRLEKDEVFLRTPLNFACTADIIGGNSGSPVVNRAGELVGLIFDGNIQSLVLDVAYDDTQARAVAVDAAGILAALRQVYGAESLVTELLGPRTEATNDDACWRPLFNGRELGSWKPTRFGGEGEVAVEDGAIRIAMGADMSGITWSGPFPRQHYEVAVESQRVEGHDFFCGLTFPVGPDPCSLIVGGWGGAVVGLSSIDGADAANNETTLYRDFKQGRWYAVRVRVTPERIECFIDDEKVVDQPLEGRTISIRSEVVPSKPLGIATYATTALVRNIRWRPLPGGDEEEPAIEGKSP